MNRILLLDSRVICERCTVADSAVLRLKGLLGRSELGPGEGVLIGPASSIHTCFMRFPIDVVFLDRDLRVLAVRVCVKPWRIAWVRGADAVLELASGECERRGIAVGATLVIV